VLLALALAAPGPGCGGREPLVRPNIVLVTLDTTRADRLGCYGYARPTSPRLDALAREGVVYQRAYAPSTWTLPSHASLFTGKYPKSHGARYDPDGPLVLGRSIEGPADWDRIRARGLGASERTLAEHLSEVGYRTGAVVGGPWMKRVFGLARGFEHYDDSGIATLNGRRAASVTRAATAWVESVRGRPFFLFLNYYDPHTPFLPPWEFVELVVPPGERPNGEARSLEELSGLYDAEILYMDHYFGLLLDRLRAMGLYDDTWIVVTADHGDLLGEHGRTGHGETLYQPELRIPLVVKPARGDRVAGGRDELIQLPDLFAMILQRVGAPLPAGTQGAFPPAPRPAYAEVNPLGGATRRGDWRAIVDGSLKYMESTKGERLLFDLERDPGEERDLAAEDPDRTRALARALDAFFAALPDAPPAGPAAEVDETTRRALENLGYLEPEREPPP
jgi:arylsulfatase A-like enzyme